jgi:hypothetical protein
MSEYPNNGKYFCPPIHKISYEMYAYRNKSGALAPFYLTESQNGLASSSQYEQEV